VRDPDVGLRTGYTYHRRIQGNHHDYLPNATYPGLCSNRAILLFHGPGIRQGVRVRNARTIDVAPTLAAIAGIDPPAQSEGHVLYQVLETC
jgi:arylsulfatase A-like enzyme